LPTMIAAIRASARAFYSIENCAKPDALSSRGRLVTLN
jgi:hypothetical protein